MKSPASPGLNVDGTMQYVPGGNRNRHVTSLRLIKALERPTDRVYLKKSVSTSHHISLNVCGLIPVKINYPNFPYMKCAHREIQTVHITGHG